MFTPMKMPRTINEQYKIVRDADEEQRAQRKISAKQATVTPSICRRIILAPDVAIPSLSTEPSTTSSVAHARPFESEPNDS